MGTILNKITIGPQNLSCFSFKTTSAGRYITQKLETYLRGQEGRRQQVTDVKRERRASPVTLGKHVEAGDSQGHQHELPAAEEMMNTGVTAQKRCREVTS